MSVTRPFELTDILRFNQVNADSWTATYHNGYYVSYLAQWPDFCVVTEGAFDDSVKSYMFAKHEPPPPDTQHHGHLTAMSISPPYRGLGLARYYMDVLERLSGPGKPTLPDEDGAGENEDNVDAFFVDLFVRCNNPRAIELYEKLGYSVFRRVVDYYSAMDNSNMTRDELDGFDMRKSMPKDSEKKYVRANGRDILVSPEQVWA